MTRVVGGPSVFPPQPDGVMNLGQMRRPWQADTGANRYRRGLYTFFWRATPNPFLTTFDAPGGVQSCTRRFRSNTPLQALTLLNDPSYIEIARGLAARISAEQPCVSGDREPSGMRSCFAWDGPLPTASSLRWKHCCEVMREPNGAMAPAWLTVARVLLNLDEFVTRE